MFSHCVKTSQRRRLRRNCVVPALCNFGRQKSWRQRLSASRIISSSRIDSLRASSTFHSSLLNIIINQSYGFLFYIAYRAILVDAHARHLSRRTTGHQAVIWTTSKQNRPVSSRPGPGLRRMNLLRLSWLFASYNLALPPPLQLATLVFHTIQNHRYPS